MRRFTNILFSPLGEDDNAAAVRRVADIAHENGASLTLYGVVPEPSGLQRAFHRVGFFTEILEAEREAMEKRLNRWATHTDVPVDRVVEVGKPGLAIIDRVVAEDHDLVVVTTDDDRHDHTSIKRLHRKCPCPVWVIRPSRARTLRVMAAVNPDPSEFELNKTILELASSMVERFGGELHVVHAWQLYGEATMRSSGFIHTAPEELDALLEEERAGHEQAMATLLAESGLETAQWHVHLVKGPAAEAVAAVVDSANINLLIMGTVARTGIPGVLIGNTAERILDDVRCSVVAVKPPGFVSPLDGRAS